MKRLLSSLALLCCLVLSALPALAFDAAPYVEARLGGSYVLVDDIKNTSAVAAPAPANKTSLSEVAGSAGLAVGLELKKSLGLPLRAELEYSYRSEVDYNPDPTFIGAGVPTRLSSTLNSQAVFANLYYDFATGTRLTPYVGGGLGVAWNHTDATGTVIATGASQDYKKTTSNFAWNLGAGATYDLTGPWKLGAGYRYVNLGKVVWGDSGTQLTSKDITSHDLYLGLRYQF